MYLRVLAFAANASLDSNLFPLGAQMDMVCAAVYGFVSVVGGLPYDFLFKFFSEKFK